MEDTAELWTAEKEERLVEMWQARPCLYQTNSAEYADRAKKFVALNEIASDLCLTELKEQQLCSNSMNTRSNQEFGWVGVLKLPPAAFMRESCVSIVKKAEIAVQRGATAVIFDVTDNPAARDELEAKSGVVLRPVVIVEGKSAKRLQSLLHKRKQSRARINNEGKKITRETSNEYFDMGIFMAFFILVSLICLVLLIKIKWRQKRKQTSLTRMALQAISRMETRKFSSSGLRSSNSACSGSRQSINTVYSCNRWPYYDIRSCAICLEEFVEGQDIRIVPCRHEFHKSCVDPWLLSNCTCPLCMLNIVEPWSKKKKSRDFHQQQQQQNRSWLRSCCCLSSCCLPEDDPMGGETGTEGELTQIGLADGTAIQSGDERHNELLLQHRSRCSSLDSRNVSLEQLAAGQSTLRLEQSHLTSLSNRDCLQPYRFHRCKLHHKKQRQHTMLPQPVSIECPNLNIDHSIVVVANLPVDNFEKLQEDVV
eukprot:gene13787-15230_t